MDVFEDPHATEVDRIEDLLSQMTLEEKTAQMTTLYGFPRVVKDELPTEEWSERMWKDGIGNIDEHMNGNEGWKGNFINPATICRGRAMPRRSTLCNGGLSKKHASVFP